MLKSNVFHIGLLDRSTLTIPQEVMEVFVKTKPERFKVIATFNDTSISFFAAIKWYKSTQDYGMMFGKRLQKELGVFQNDYFELQLFEDDSKYGVELPEELEAVFQSDLEAFEIFENLTSGLQRSIIYAIIRIKKSQTRIDKALIMCDNLRRGECSPIKLFKPYSL